MIEYKIPGVQLTTKEEENDVKKYFFTKQTLSPETTLAETRETLRRTGHTAPAHNMPF